MKRTGHPIGQTCDSREESLKAEEERVKEKLYDPDWSSFSSISPSKALFKALLT